MPNHVTTRCVVTGPAPSISVFKAFHIGNDDELFLDFNTIVPEPEGLHEMSPPEAAFPAWYSWRGTNWGTKWNSYSFRWVDDYQTEFLMDTAWGFPEPIFRELAARYPDLTFDCACFDEGWMFAGEGFFVAGGKNFEIKDADDIIYEKVYGHAPEPEDDA